MRLLLALLFASFAASRFLSGAFAGEAFLKPNDVIALVGGEDMVAAAEYGYLELLLTRALPDHRLKFRCLAWEGDTVFEQRRDLNFPTWEEQLDKIGATVVICQFGQMESLMGEKKLPEFIAAYEKLLTRFSGGGKRRVAMLTPFQFAQSAPNTPDDVARFDEQRHLANHQKALEDYCVAIRRLGMPHIPGLEPLPGEVAAHLKASNSAIVVETSDLGVDDLLVQRDGMHLNRTGHFFAAGSVAMHMDAPARTDRSAQKVAEPLRELIVAKNQLWDRYWRVQNWAFLAGDRTTQASSRDHRDPTKRWFPAEREQFLPLIEKKEQEIRALAAQLR